MDNQGLSAESRQINATSLSTNSTFNEPPPSYSLVDKNRPLPPLPATEQRAFRDNCKHIYPSAGNIIGCRTNGQQTCGNLAATDLRLHGYKETQYTHLNGRLQPKAHTLHVIASRYPIQRETENPVVCIVLNLFKPLN